MGYRPFLLGLSESLEIERIFADKSPYLNTGSWGSQAVYALIDSSEEKVKAFIEIASSKFPENSHVEKVKEEDYTGSVMKTESYYRYLTAMQLSKIATYGGRMLEKQDETTKAIKDLSGRVDQSREEISTEVRALRDDLKYHLDERLSRIEIELSQIKAKVGL